MFSGSMENGCVWIFFIALVPGSRLQNDNPTEEPSTEDIKICYNVGRGVQVFIQCIYRAQVCPKACELEIEWKM